MDAVAQVVKNDFTTFPFLDGLVIGNVSGYSTQEDATPLVSGDTSGGTPDFTVTGQAGPKSDLGNGESLILISEDRGEMRGNISAVQHTTSSELVTLTADSLIKRLNAEVKALPQHTYNPLPVYPQTYSSVQRSFNYYCSLVGIGPTDVLVDSDIAELPFVAPGFKGNLWNYMKQMCAAYGWQIYASGQRIGLTLAGKVELYIKEPTSVSIAENSQNRAQKILMPNGNFKATAEIIGGLYGWTFFAADEVYSDLAPREVRVIKVQTNGTPSAVCNPVAVSSITSLPYTYGTGEYVVWGADGFVVSPAYWNGNGGKITAALDPDDANGIIITITAPNIDPSSPRAPFKISEGNDDRPALYITGAGVQTNSVDQTVYTGDSKAPDEFGPDIDNIFIGNKDRALKAGAKTASSYSGVQATLSISGVPDVTIIKKGYTDYTSGGVNMLKDTQASMGRKNNVLEGWTGWGRRMLQTSAAGARFTGPCVPTLPLLVSYDLTSVSCSAFNYDQDRTAFITNQNLPYAGGGESSAYWCTQLQPSTSYTFSMRLTRISGSATVRPYINFQEAPGLNILFTGTVYGSTIAVTNGVSTTFTLTATSPAPVTFNTIWANMGLEVVSGTSADYLFENAYFGTVNQTPPAFVDVAESEITDWYGSVAGSVLRHNDSKYRVISARYGPTSVDLECQRYVRFKDHSEVWKGKTFTNFDTAWAGAHFRQYNVKPLSVSP